MKLYEIKEKRKFNQDDQKILKILVQNPRIKISKVADILDIPRERVSYRIKRIKNLGLLQGFCSIVNFPKTNYRYYVIVGRIKDIEK